MKEISTNIERYNENGICVGCLNYKRKMYYRDEVKKCFKLLANIDVPDGLTIQVCWECLAYVRNVMRFQDQILKAYDILYNYSRKHTLLNFPNDFVLHAPNRLKIFMEAVTDSCPVYRDNEEPQVKVEGNPKDEIKTDPDTVKLELENYDSDTVKSEPESYDPNTVKSEPEDSGDQFNEDLPNQDHNTISDDDMQLSNLNIKQEKESKIDMKRIAELENSQESGSGKFKNLLSDLVELYTMTEQEMWQIRTEDVSHKEFVKLKYKCDDCITTFNMEKPMTKHIKRRHEKKLNCRHQCDVCKAYFLSKEYVSAHRSLHLRAFRCRTCGFTTTLRRVMMNHVTIHKNMTQDSYKCTLCDDVFSSKAKLESHRSLRHQEKLLCDCCGKAFANKMSLFYHLKLLSLKEGEKPAEKVYICKKCTKVFHCKKSYKAHVVTHDGPKYLCPICGNMYMLKRSLAKHIRNHRERDAGTKHECKECKKTFASKVCYKNHMKTSKKHAGETAYIHECDYCGKKFVKKYLLADHINWKHLQKFNYKCNVCLKAFQSAQLKMSHFLTRHVKKKHIETVREEHACEICGKSYKTEKILKDHVWAMHTSRPTMKVFKCELCPSTFAWQTSIYDHMKTMHNISNLKQSSIRELN